LEPDGFRDTHMFLDIAYLAAAAAAFLGCWWFVVACDRL
jgi:hypothetical protein